jgi:bidirectional [NiFe] hydrogenase diaphorase subunit
MLSLTIDGKGVTAPVGSTVLAAAKAHGIDIPVLCHSAGLSEVGSCRVCVVEVVGSARLLPACSTPVSEGMAVRTDSDRVRADRRMVVELLFAERNHVCAACVADGCCELQDLAVRTGVDHVRVGYLWPALAVDLTHPKFGLDHNRCVLCTRCVRVCAEVEKADTWAVADKGIGDHIAADLGRPWGESQSCTSCGKCVEICPTGALFHKGTTVAGREKQSCH